jgi:hypothetical protein
MVRYTKHDRDFDILTCKNPPPVVVVVVELKAKYLCQVGACRVRHSQLHIITSISFDHKQRLE